MSSLTFKKLQRTNARRAVRWHRQGLHEWSALEWAGAMCGEAGEAANAAKKLKRVMTQMQNNDKRLFKQKKSLRQQLAHYRRETAKEVADTIIYGVLLIEWCGQDAEKMIRKVFNQKSREYGFPERL